LSLFEALATGGWFVQKRKLTAMYIELNCTPHFRSLSTAPLPRALALTESQIGYPELATHRPQRAVWPSMAFDARAKQVGLQAITGAEIPCSTVLT